MVVRSPHALTLGVQQEWSEQFRDTVKRSTASAAMWRWSAVVDCTMVPVESRN